jgi:hypothetical protein|tara:strand:+ start:228 stop:398 length:171 start_codon:yes stop_codon:yes gene_type:complete
MNNYNAYLFNQKYYIKYIKRGRLYEFTTSFKNKEHMERKLLDYKKDSLSFKIRKLI